MMRHAVSAAALILAAGCADSPTEPVEGLGISWLEWPVAVTQAQPGAVRITATRTCTHRPVFHAALHVNALYFTELRITVTAVRDDMPCMVRGENGSGAGYDTLLPLPALPGVAGQFSVPVFAPMALSRYGPVPIEVPGEGVRRVGTLVLGTVPDTTTMLAGYVALTANSTDRCWVAQPFSSNPRPLFAFLEPVPMEPSGSRSGFVTGRLVSAAAPVCGQSLVIDATELVVDVAP